MEGAEEPGMSCQQKFQPAVCTICLESPLQVPIFQCRNGHLLCSSCENRVQVCPTCNQGLAKFRKIRNLAVEQMQAQLHYCANYSDGCSEVFLETNAKDVHEAICDFRVKPVVENQPQAKLPAVFTSNDSTTTESSIDPDDLSDSDSEDSSDSGDPTDSESSADPNADESTATESSTDSDSSTIQPPRKRRRRQFRIDSSTDSDSSTIQPQRKRRCHQFRIDSSTDSDSSTIQPPRKRRRHQFRIYSSSD